MRWEDLAEPWRVCLEEAWAAYRAGSLPIGAAIADPAGAVVARGRNRIHEHEADGGQLHGHRLAHAEINALVALDHRALDPGTCTLYTTTEPCPLCTGAIRIARIGTVRYATRDSVGGSIALLAATPYMRRGVVRVIGPERDDLETFVAALYVECTLHAGEPDRVATLLDCWGPVLPDGVALGRALHASGALRRLGASGTPIAVVLDRLAGLLPPGA